MQITTWNVNGIRAVLQKGALNWVSQVQTDVLCLQEVKAYREQVNGLDELLSGYDGYWNSAAKAGYSGVAVYTRVKPLEVTYGLGDDRFDNEGRVIRVRFPDFVLYNIYFPNGQRGHDRVEYKLDFYACLLEQCDRLHAAGDKIVITGDFNTSHREIDLANPRENSKTSGFMPEERAWIDRYLDHQFCDAYRRIYPTKVEYTWWTYISNARARNVGWRLDYFLVTEAMFDRVRDVVIHGDLHGSDHCPVSLLVDTE